MSKFPRLFKGSHQITLTAKERMIFCKRFSLVLHSGMPLKECLLMLEEEQGNTTVRAVARVLHHGVSEGKPISEQMAQLPRAFDEFTIQMVRVGEATATLAKNLSFVAEDLKRREQVRKRVLGALLYPCIILIATTAIALSLTLYIFPKITPIFRGFKNALPLSTQIVIGVSDALLHHWFLYVCGVVIIVASISFLFKIQRIRSGADRLLLLIPVFGSLSRSYNLANSSRTLALLLSGAVRTEEAFLITARCLRNVSYKTAFVSIAKKVHQGNNPAREFKLMAQLFPPLFCQMISVGERTGDLPGSLLYLSDIYEEELNDMTRSMTTLLEPLLMIGMGAVVGFIAVAIIAPLYGITQNLNTYQ